MYDIKKYKYVRYIRYIKIYEPYIKIYETQTTKEAPYKNVSLYTFRDKEEILDRLYDEGENL